MRNLLRPSARLITGGVLLILMGLLLPSLSSAADPLNPSVLPSILSIILDGDDAPVSYALTVSQIGNNGGSGTVTSNPAGINCGSICSANFDSGVSVTLTATPASGSTFAGWSGACTNSSGTCTVTMDAAKNVTATFNRIPPTYRLTVTKAGNGSGTVSSVPAGITCGADCNEDFSGAITLNATAANGSIFVGWSGGGCSGTGSCTVTMDAAKTVTATFNAISSTFALTVTKTGTGSGTVTSTPSGINCGSTCNANFSGNVTLTATPASGSIFAGWSGSGCSGTGSCTVTMDAAKTVTATFNAISSAFALTVTKTGTGSGTVTSTPSGINCGATCSANFSGNVTLTATAAPGSTFAGWGGACSGAGSCTVTMDTAKTVAATFTAASAANDDFVVLQNSSPDIIGAGPGNDTYLLTPYLLTSARTLTLTDAQGNNRIQLAAGLQISSSGATSNALLLTLSNGARLTVLGADGLSYQVCGNATIGLNPTPVTFATFALNTLGISVPASASTVATGGPVTISCP